MFDLTPPGRTASGTHEENGDDDRAREMISVGYSGGFAPLAEVLVNNIYNEVNQTGYNSQGLVGLGASFLNISDAAQGVIDRLGILLDVVDNAHQSTAEFLSDIGIELQRLEALARELSLLALGDHVAEATLALLRTSSFTSAYEYLLQKGQEMIDRIMATPPIDLTSTGMNLVVNVYGTNDVLNSLGVGASYQTEIGGYRVDDRNHPLVNVEIVGADHHDYIRGDSELWGSSIMGTAANLMDYILSAEDRAWNRTVADFVAGLVNNSQSKEIIDSYLGSWGTTVASYDEIRSVWVINL